MRSENRLCEFADGGFEGRHLQEEPIRLGVRERHVANMMGDAAKVLVPSLPGLCRQLVFEEHYPKGRLEQVLLRAEPIAYGHSRHSGGLAYFPERDRLEPVFVYEFKRCLRYALVVHGFQSFSRRPMSPL